MFGVAEVIGLAGSCFVLLLVLLSYLYFLVPARSRMASLEADKKQVQTNLQTLNGVVKQGRDTKDTVERIAASLDKFQNGNLLNVDQGKMDLYEEPQSDDREERAAQYVRPGLHAARSRGHEVGFRQNDDDQVARVSIREFR
jgi:hypothetical protein